MDKVRILAITLVKFEDHTKGFYIDELKKVDNSYYWDEVDHYREEFNISRPFYFIKILNRQVNDDSSYAFKEKHFRFVTTIEKIKKKYDGIEGAGFNF